MSLILRLEMQVGFVCGECQSLIWFNANLLKAAIKAIFRRDMKHITDELEAEILGEEAQLMGIQFLQLEIRLGKIPSRSFRPVKSAEILWQFWASSSFGVSLAYDGSWSKWELSLWLCG
ncbi:hypothetical protein Tco_0727230 [Tanacetum coccineum]|uniref:Uncharacterized protein n=1 Tax=Tanacetum coccineum TaxID=301880 RepID=A0ABQ4YHU8_9ASTR